jgi:hypothetical protein
MTKFNGNFLTVPAAVNIVGEPDTVGPEIIRLDVISVIKERARAIRTSVIRLGSIDQQLLHFMATPAKKYSNFCTLWLRLLKSTATF